MKWSRISPYHHPPTNKSAMDWVYWHRIRSPNHFAATKGNPHTPVKYHEKSLSQPIQTIRDQWHVGRCIPRCHQRSSARKTLSRQPRERFRASQGVHGEGRDETGGVPPKLIVFGTQLSHFWGSNRWCCKEDESKVHGSQNTGAHHCCVHLPRSCTQLVENFYGWTYITHRIHLSVGSEPSTWETKSGCSSGGYCCSTFMCHHSS